MSLNFKLELEFSVDFNPQTDFPETTDLDKLLAAVLTAMQENGETVFDLYREQMAALLEEGGYDREIAAQLKKTDIAGIVAPLVPTLDLPQRLRRKLRAVLNAGKRSTAGYDTCDTDRFLNAVGDYFGVPELRSVRFAMTPASVREVA